MNFTRDRKRDLLRPGRKHQLRNLIGQIAGAENAGERGEQDEERKHRHQRGERDVARDRPTVVGEETPIGIEGDIESSSHRNVQLWPFVTIPKSARVIPSGHVIPSGQQCSNGCAKSRQATRHGSAALLLCTARVVLGVGPCKLSGCRSTERALEATARSSPCWTKLNAATLGLS